MPTERDIAATLREASDWSQDGGPELRPMLLAAADEIEKLRARVLELEAKLSLHRNRSQP